LYPLYLLYPPHLPRPSYPQVSAPAAPAVG